jgi:hypothetical protein
MGCSGDRYINDHSGAQHWSVLLDVGSLRHMAISTILD